MPAVLGVLERHFDRVIVLPSSFDPAEDRVRAALAASRATVFARERESYRRIAGLCEARLAHDCAFYFDGYESYRRTGSGTLNAFRTDLEAAGDGALPPGNDDISATAATLHDWLTAIAEHALVRTDRAHVLIAAALMGKRVEYAPGDYFKNDGLAETLPPGVTVTRIATGRAARSPRRPDPPVAPAREAMLQAGRHRPAAPPIRPVGGAARVCAAVLSRNRGEHVAAAVRSVTASGDGVRALVLDANSGPRTRRQLDDLAREVRVDVHLTDRNLGCAGGRELLTTLATEELILFLDDDAELMPGALERLVADLDAHPGAQAVSALVTDPDGRVAHCGGSLERTAEVARFTLDGAGLAFDDPDVPASGRCDWVPGSAVLVRRSVFDACPVDPAMNAYYEDNDWSLRMAQRFCEPFRRCREALAIHHAVRAPITADVMWRDHVARRLAMHARFLERHGVLLHSGGEELRDVLGWDRPDDPATARLLLRLVTAYGSEWLLAEWIGGDLATVLARGADEHGQPALLTRERDSWRDRALALEAERQGDAEGGGLAWLRERHETLARVEAGGWWRLRGRLLPLLRTAGRVQRAVAGRGR